MIGIIGIIIVVVFLYGIYDYCKFQRVAKAKKQSDSERKTEHEKFMSEYNKQQSLAVKDQKAHQRRPDDWTLRTSYILKRDGYKCVICGSRDNLHVHHIVPVSVRPDHSEHNLITLCIRCHDRQAGQGHNGLMSRSIGAQCSKYNFKKVIGRKEYKCDSCGKIIAKGKCSYKKGYWNGSISYISKKIPDRTIRICEDCLLNFNQYSDNTMRC